MQPISFDEYVESIKFGNQNIEKDMCDLIKNEGIKVHLKLTFKVLTQADDNNHTNKGLKNFICGGYKASGDEHLAILVTAFYQMEMLRISQIKYKTEQVKKLFISLIKTNHEAIKLVKDPIIRGMMFTIFFECVRLTYIFFGFSEKNYISFLQNVHLNGS